MKKKLLMFLVNQDNTHWVATYIFNLPKRRETMIPLDLGVYQKWKSKITWPPFGESALMNMEKFSLIEHERNQEDEDEDDKWLEEQQEENDDEEEQEEKQDKTTGIVRPEEQEEEKEEELEETKKEEEQEEAKDWVLDDNL